jgi:hypothetical protein
VNSVNSSIRYQLKPGVFIAEDGENGVFIGLPHRGLCLQTPIGISRKLFYERLSHTLQPTHKFSRQANPSTLKQTHNNTDTQTNESNVSEIDIAEYLTLCLNHNLIEKRDSEGKEHKNYEEQNHLIAQHLFASERYLESWRNVQLSDQQLTYRRNKSIGVYGENRISLALISLIISAGYRVVHIPSQTNWQEMGEIHRFSQGKSARRDLNTRISQDQLSGVGAWVGEMGRSYAQFVHACEENFGWAKKQMGGNEKLLDLIIAVQHPQPEHLQIWMSQGITHLVISPIQENFIEVGPIITPGKSACMRCIHLWRIDHLPHSRDFLINTLSHKQQEMPSGAVSLVAGHLLLEINNYFASDASLLNQSLMVRINLFSPSRPEHITWQPHSQCGCIAIP